MFLGIDEVSPNRLAAIDDCDRRATYGDLCSVAEEMDSLGLPRSVVFCLCENSVGSLAGYLAFESAGQVPLLLSSTLDDLLLKELDETYRPSYYWIPENLIQAGEKKPLLTAYGYGLVETSHQPYELNGDLSLLLTTSGSTGSAKLVRYKYGNLEANARNVASVFGWTAEERGICDLPMNYTMGLNVINTLLVSGATALLVESNLMAPRFWEFVREQRGTSFCGVPYSYEILRRLGFDKMDLPDLRTLAQGGGRLTDKMFRWLADLCAQTDRRFFATFGTTETSARMTYLPPELSTIKTGSIGRAIPEGELFLEGETPADDDMREGELCYRGPNVTMGYALCREDLAKGDEFKGEYHTGDIAHRDEDGCYYIIGRKGRFLKLFGLRVGLDETEGLVRSEFGCDCACTGTDQRMDVFVTTQEAADGAAVYLSQKTGIHHSAFRVTLCDDLPRNDYGKIRYAELGKAL